MMFDNLHDAQLRCVELGDGCGGITGFRNEWQNDGYPMWELRQGTEFVHSQNDEFSYLKPKKLCHYDTGRTGIWVPGSPRPG